ncbi:hypothetical protein JZ751_016129 [Albula glossodonta]|uniref:Anoctamin n=1 Tax=Albula glossodonta TaxID=121402 RepID=A0A8T2NZ52_9TELE|nr:hypothetical protein JZ751_016129 [Albula glossodonta]
MPQPSSNDKLPVVNSVVEMLQDNSSSGLYFADGRRKVDYVLVYYCRRRSSFHGSPLQHRLSIISNGSFHIPVSLPCDPQRRSSEPEVVDLGPTDPADGEKVLIREEFEASLVEAGLEIERDKEKSYGQNFVRLHAPWPVLCREAEILKVKVPTKKSYELKREKGLSGTMNAFWRKLNEPFQPKVPQPHDQGHVKYLSHCFSRDKLHLYNIKHKDTFFDNTTRSRIVYEILRRTSCTRSCQTMGISTLIAKGVYTSAFPLHDGDYKTSGDGLRNDRQIGLYFAWLGVYTQLLIPASVMCDERQNFTMCPLCDRSCDYWDLSTACSTARASHLFDNPATVFFAIFMSLWAAMFLEHWKRRQISLNYSWDLTGMDEEEEHPRPKYETLLLQKRKKKMRNKKKSKNESDNGLEEGPDVGKGKWRQRLLSAVSGMLPPGHEKLTWRDRMPGYIINISSILFMFGVTFSAVFGVIIYRITISALMAMSPDPDLKSNVRVTVTATAVIINLVVILILDEIYGSVAVWLTELEIPKTETDFEERLILKAFLLKFMNAYAPIFYVAFFKGRFAGRPGDYVYVFNDYRMEECAPGGCLIELCIQLSIIMLGKQLIQNNIFEIGIPSASTRRSSSLSYGGQTLCERKTSAFVISFTSDFIPRLVYLYMYSETGTMHGFIDHTLSYFNVSNFKPGTAPTALEDPEVIVCRYKDYREPPWSPQAYQFSKQYWSVLAARLAFVILFQNLVMFLSMLVDWVIPDVPKDISEQLKREKTMLVDVFLREEKDKIQLIQNLPSSCLWLSPSL